MSVGRTVMAALLLLGAACPTVGAQTPRDAFSLQLEKPQNTTLAPGGEPIRLLVTLNVECGSAYTELRADLTVESPGFASVSVEPAQHRVSSLTGACTPGQRLTWHSNLSVAMVADAPALTPATFRVNAVYVPSTAAGPGPRTLGNATAVLRADYVDRVIVSPATYFQRAPPNRRVVFPIDFVNLGNGPTVVGIDIMQPNAAKLDMVIPPAEIHLESKAERGAAATFKAVSRIEAQTPRAEGRYTFIATFQSTYDGPVAGEFARSESSLTLGVEVVGSAAFGDTPAPGAALGLALMAGAAVLVRRRTR